MEAQVVSPRWFLVSTELPRGPKLVEIVYQPTRGSVTGGFDVVPPLITCRVTYPTGG